MTLYEKLIAIQSRGFKFGKDWTNPHFKSKYLTLDHLLDKLLPELTIQNILVYHITKDGNIETHIYDIESKEELVSCFPIGDTSNPQKVWSALTYWKRYNLWQLFNIVTDDDDDGNKASVKDEKDSFNKPNFGKRNMDNLKAAIEKWERTKNKEETLAYLEATYNLKDDARWWTEEYFDRLPNVTLEVPEQVATDVKETFNS